jgi:hypothetical protein
MQVLLLLVACGGNPPAAPPEKPAAPAAPAAGEAVGHDHGDAAAHGHGAKHGGIQKELEGLHVEGLAMAGAVMFWPSDANANALPVDGFSGNAVIKGPSGVEKVELMPMGDHLHAPAKLEHGKPATIVLTLSRDGKAQSITFEIEAVGLATHDHTSLHGGAVSMWGDFHVEYLAKEGVHRFWVTDAKREMVTMPLSGKLRDGDQELPLAVEASTGMLSVAAPGAGTRPVTVEIQAGAASFSLGFNATPSP